MREAEKSGQQPGNLPGYHKTAAAGDGTPQDASIPPDKAQATPPLPAGWEAVFSALPDAVIVYDAEGDVARANPAAVRAFGFDPAGMGREERTRRFAIRYPDGRPVPADALPSARALRGETVARECFLFTNAQGRDLTIVASASPVPDGDRVSGAVVAWHNYSPGDDLCVELQTDIAAHERTEQGLRESEERLRLFIEHAPAAIAMFDCNMRYLVASRRWREDYGLGDQPIIGRSHYEVFPEIGDAWKAVHLHGLTGEVVQAMEDRFERADGTVQWLRWEVQPWCAADGKVGGIVIFTEDITERKQTEAERERLLAELTATMDAVPAGIVAYSPSGSATRMNPAAARMTGCTLADHELPMAELFARLRWATADGTPMPLEDFPPARALRGERAGSVVMAFRRDGQKVWIYAGAEPVRAADGAILGAVFSCVDISELRALQVQQQGLLADLQQRATELAFERDRLRIVVESIADAVFVCDAAGKITLVNKAGLVLIGAEHVEAVGMLADYLSTLQPRSLDGHPVPLQELAISQALRSEVVLDRQEIGVHPLTHRRVDLLVSAAPLRDGENRVVGAVEVVRDITELRELDRMKDEFLGVAAHELKTPVTITKGYSQVLLHSAQNLSQPQRRMLESIDRGADRIDNLVSDLLDLVRLQSEGLRLHRDRINLAELAEEVVDRIAAMAPRHRLRLVQKEPVVVQGDRRRLEQVLETLLDNALRYSPGGGDVDLSVSVADTAAVVTVRDYGVGIPADRQARIGQRFYRAHTGTPYDYGGMGVGLYIAREIVERHGGRLWFESEEGKGSTFHFSLPLQVENVDAR